MSPLSPTDSTASFIDVCEIEEGDSAPSASAMLRGRSVISVDHVKPGTSHRGQTSRRRKGRKRLTAPKKSRTWKVRCEIMQAELNKANEELAQLRNVKERQAQFEDLARQTCETRSPLSTHVHWGFSGHALTEVVMVPKGSDEPESSQPEALQPATYSELLTKSQSMKKLVEGAEQDKYKVGELGEENTRLIGKLSYSQTQLRSVQLQLQQQNAMAVTDMLLQRQKDQEIQKELQARVDALETEISASKYREEQKNKQWHELDCERELFTAQLRTQLQQKQSEIDSLLKENERWKSAVREENESGPTGSRSDYVIENNAVDIPRDLCIQNPDYLISIKSCNCFIEGEKEYGERRLRVRQKALLDEEIAAGRAARRKRKKSNKSAEKESEKPKSLFVTISRQNVPATALLEDKQEGLKPKN